jgi:hypothetical protein
MRPVAVTYNGDTIKGSVRRYTVFHTSEGGYFDPQNSLYDPTVLLLAKVYVRPSSAPEDIIVLDTRTRGGGLKDEYNNQNYWDIGMTNGDAYPSQGIVIAHFPQTILKQYGGQFTESEVETAVNRYLAFGVKAIIEYV